MRVLVVSGREQSGGAWIATERLCTGLVRIGVEVAHVVYSAADGGDRDYSVRELRPVPGESLVRWAARRVPRRSLRAAVGALDSVTARRLQDFVRSYRPDVINVHNIHGPRWGPRIVAGCAEVRPTVWSLHDMWSFTGGCTYSYDCRLYAHGCDERCPVTDEYPRIHPAAVAPSWRHKTALISRHENLWAVTPSEWLRDRACEGAWPGERVEVIPYGLDTDRFRPVPRREARDRLDLPADGKLVLMMKARERRKGLFLQAGIARHLADDVRLVLFGRGDLPRGLEGREVTDVGYVSDRDTMSLLYNAADVYLHPAAADNYPNCVMEAAACSTPVVAFAVGGIPEMVEEGADGHLAEPFDLRAAAAAVHRAIEEGRGGNGADGGDRSGRSRERQARAYTALFDRMTAKE